MSYRVTPPKLSQPKSTASVQEHECPLCHGLGGKVVQRDNPALGAAYRFDVFIPCACRVLKTAKARMGEALWSQFSKGPMDPFIEQRGSDMIDRTRENCFVTATPNWFLPRLARVIAGKMVASLEWPFKVVTDAEIRDALFAEPKITQALVQGDFLVLQLGFMGSGHKLVGPAVFEIVSERVRQGRSTWVVDEPYARYGPKHHAWHPRMEEVLETRFTRIIEE